MTKITDYLNKFTQDELKALVAHSKSITEFIKLIGVPRISGSTYKTIKKYLLEHNIDYNELATRGKYSGLTKPTPKDAIPLEEVLVENSSYSRRRLKERLLANGMLENKCSICGLEPHWNNKKLVMILDHINGVNNDNRIENLRLVCPNCNSQLDTFCGKNKALLNDPNRICPICGGPKKKESKVCFKCLKNKPMSG